MAFEDAWWKYFLVPFIDGFVGYITNVLALQMTFAPLEFLGIEIFRLPGQPWGFFGWQGIIPTKAEKIASISFDLVTTRLLNISEIFDKVDPAQFAKAMDDAILLLMDKVINEVAMDTMPQTWSSIPESVRDDIVVTADNESGKFLSGFIKDMQANIYDIVDIKEMAVNACVQNKHLIVKIFQECGADVIVVEPTGENMMDRLMDLVLLGDFISLIHAEVNGTDPVEIDNIDRLKDALAKV